MVNLCFWRDARGMDLTCSGDGPRFNEGLFVLNSSDNWRHGRDIHFALATAPRPTTAL